jgi:type IV pilus assembly PilO-like protein
VTTRDRNVLLVVGALAALAAFWFLALAPKREDAQTVKDQIATARKKLDAAQTAAANAEAAQRRYTDDYATVARLGKAVPVQDEVPSLVYQLQSTASSNKIDFRSIQLEAQTAATTATPATQAANAVAAANGTTPNATNESTGTASATNAAAAVLPPGAAVGPAGFPTMPFSFSFDGGFFDMQHFLHSIAGFTTTKGKQIAVRGRLLTVDGFALTASREGFPKVKASVRATAYLLPSDQGLTGGATPTSPGGAGGTTASSTSTAPTTSAVIAGGTR